jgi:predicted alpha/beta-hydrolase family hydrolase
MSRQEEAANITQFSQGAVRGFLHRPVEATQAAGVVLTHGASGNSKAPLLVEVARAFCDAGFWVLRCDLPFRQRRPFGPPSPHSTAGDRAGLVEAIQALRSFAPGPIILGGTRMEGAKRACSRPKCLGARRHLSCCHIRCIHPASLSKSVRRISARLKRRRCLSTGPGIPLGQLKK